MADCCEIETVSRIYRGKDGHRLVVFLCQGCGSAMIGKYPLTGDVWPDLHAVTMDDYRLLRDADKEDLVRAILEPIRAYVIAGKVNAAS